MHLLKLLSAIFLLSNCGSEHSSSPPMPEAESTGWIITSEEEISREELGQQGFHIEALQTEEDNDSPYFAPGYSPAYTNSPMGYRAPALSGVGSNASANNWDPVVGSVVSGVNGGLYGPFPGYGGIVAGGALPGAAIVPGAVVGGVTEPPTYPQPPTRDLRPYLGPYYVLTYVGGGYPYRYRRAYPTATATRRPVAIPVRMTAAANTLYRPRPLKPGEPLPVIVLAPNAYGYYQPIVTFR